MEYRSLGRSGLKVSVLCYGTVTFANDDATSWLHGIGTARNEAFQVLDRALGAGVNFIDTADTYGKDGMAERVLGEWFKAHKRRDDVILATKCRFRTAPGPNGVGASRYRIARAVEASLKRLQTDRIDLLQVHGQDNFTPEEETLRAFDDLVRAGKVLYIGASNYGAPRLVESLWASEKLGLERFVSLQANYSLVLRDMELEHAPLCLRHGLALLPWAPLAGGFLSGKYQRGATAPNGSRLERRSDRLEGFDTERNWRVVDELRSVAGELGATPAQVAIAWLLRSPAVTSVVFGARSLGQLEQNLAAASVALSDDHYRRLDEVSAMEVRYPYDFLRNQERF